MKKIFLIVILIPILLLAQPKEEVRAVWLTTAFGLDWPKSHEKEKQKEEIINILNQLKSANFNTIMLQVRARGDLIYPSKIEPWAKVLTGKLGIDPGYDPLKFIIDEAHKRGIEIHAWWNVFKVYGRGRPSKSFPEHVVLKYPEMCKIYHNEWWIDPGFPKARSYLLNLAMEMARNYDIDGIHLDYIRYPNKDFNDDETYKEFGHSEDKANWRRNNITMFVESLYDSLQAVKPSVKLGCAPIGIYKNTSMIRGWEAYYDTFQDPVKWLKDKKMDYISPQTYWSLNSPPRYDLVVNEWRNISTDRHIYPGIAVFRLSHEYGGWSSNEILTQIDTLRKLDIKGEVFFRTDELISDEKNILTLIKQKKFNYPANIPPMPWKNNKKPMVPYGLTSFQFGNSYLELYWKNQNSSSESDAPVYVNIYASTKYPVDISDPANILAFRIPAYTNRYTIDLHSMDEGKYYIVVTALNRGNNESPPSSTITFTKEHINNPVILAKGQNK